MATIVSKWLHLAIDWGVFSLYSKFYLVALQTAEIWKFKKVEKCYRQTDREKTENRETNYRGPSNRRTDGMPGRAGKYSTI